MVKLSRPAFFCLALILLVFAFVTALSLFFPEWFTRWRRSQPDPGIEQAADASELQPQAAQRRLGCQRGPPGTRSGRAALDGETGYGGAPWTRTSVIG